MILCKFTKTDSAVYIPHLDLLREMGRAVRRANLDIAFSEGFNPHMLLFFSQPLPLGLDSVCEYFCADSKEDPNKFKDCLNKKLPRGVEILGSVRCDKAEVHAITTHAAYRYKKAVEKPSQADLDSIMSRTTVEIPVKTKKGIAVSDVRGRIYSLKADGNDVVAVLGCGRENLRADWFGKYLASEFGWNEDWTVEKEEVYTERSGVLTSIDNVFGLTASHEPKSVGELS